MVKKSISVRDRYIEALSKNSDLQSLDIELLKKKLWYCYRNKSAGGLRLSDSGLSWFQEQLGLKSYRIEIPRELSISGRILIWLDRFIETPYHLEENHITVFADKTAFEIYMFSGDIRKLGAAKAMAKNFQQQTEQ